MIKYDFIFWKLTYKYKVKEMEMESSICKVILLFLVVMISYSCTKDKQLQQIQPIQIISEYSTAEVLLKVNVGTSPLEWDTVKYINAAGNTYGIQTFNLYISNIILKRVDGKFYTSKKVFYLDPRVLTKNKFILDSIPPGIYNEISFNVGIDSAKNVTFGLPATTDNINMAWPDMMGGGYHFIKLEGNYLDVMNVKNGFAVHLGKNVNLSFIKVFQTMNQNNSNNNYTLSFDVNEVFTNPYLYNFNIDNNYTMVDSVAMFKIKTNISDAFKIDQNN